MKVSSISTEKIQCESILSSEVAVVLDILSDKIKNRRDEKSHTTKHISITR
jgi:hypothetical protein